MCAGLVVVVKELVVVEAEGQRGKRKLKGKGMREGKFEAVAGDEAIMDG